MRDKGWVEGIRSEGILLVRGTEGMGKRRGA